MAKGVRVTARAVRQASHNRWPTAGSPCRAAVAPRCQDQHRDVQGRINSASNSPPRLRPTVRAAPTAPSRLSTGVPNSNEPSSTGKQRAGRPSISASKAPAAPVPARKKPVCQYLGQNQKRQGCGETTHCSSDPSSKSLRKSPSSESRTANRPPPRPAPEKGFATIASQGRRPGEQGDDDSEEHQGLASSAGRRNSRRASRATTRPNTRIMRRAVRGRVRGSRRGHGPCCGGW